MGSGLREIAAARCAETIIESQGVTALPVSPSAIARSEGIEVRALPGSTPGISGVLMRADTVFAIAYATYLDNEGFQRFSIAHELGHYFLPGHPEALLAEGVHQSQAGFVSKDAYELEADHFAASLLMPRLLFDPVLDQIDSGLEAVQTLAETCQTSLTATAIRYAQRSPDGVAVVMSTGERVDYCFLSDSLRELPDRMFLKKGTPVPRGTVTARFNTDSENISRARRADGLTGLSDWFDTSYELEMYEEVVGLGHYGKTLTVLTADDVPDPEEFNEEQALRNSWTPRFRR